MSIQPQIVPLSSIRLVGKRIDMSFATNRTKDLWQSFIPNRSEIRNTAGSALYSVEVYGPDFFSNFNPHQEFEKWAAVQVADFEQVPHAFEALEIPDGLYAVFQYKGKASAAATFYQYVFGTWLPSSGFSLDNRPHFAIMGEKYKNEDPASEEELWFPVNKV